MAEVLTDAFISIDGVNLSQYSNQVTITSSKDVHDTTGFGATHRQKTLGLGDGTMEFNFFQSFAAAAVDATLWPIHSAGTAVPIIVRKSSNPVSATNPQWTMTGVLPEYNPLSASVGDPSETGITFENSAQTGIVRATA